MPNKRRRPATHPDDIIDTAAAAAVLGVSARRVLALIADGRLKSQLLNPQATRPVHLIRRGDLEAIRDRPPGRPRSA